MLTEIQRVTVVAATAAFALALVNAAGARPDLLEETGGPAYTTVAPDGYQPQLQEQQATAQLRDRPDGYQPQLHLQPIGYEAETGGGADGTTVGLLAALLLALTASAGVAATLRTRHRVVQL